jgi:hypothetical protein
MQIATLELNDQNLLIQTEDGTIHSQPGFALVTDSGIETGEEARALAWSRPQDSYHDFWRQLNQVPLPIQYTWARHHADIAYAQLKRILIQAKSPEKLIIAVPGSFSDEQLSLLLGLTKSLGTNVVSVIDSALAACADQKKATALVELQLHQAIVSFIEHREDRQVVCQQEVIPNIGISQIYNSVAHYISKTLIKIYRYDPLHTSEGAQEIYNQIPEWFAKFRLVDSISIVLKSPQGELTLKLQKKDIEKLLNQRLGNLKSAINKHSNVELLFSYGAILIPTIIKEYAEANVLSPSCIVKNCLDLGRNLTSSELYRVTSSPKTISKSKEKNKKKSYVTHILYDGYAYPASKKLGITIAGAELHITNAHNCDSDFVVVVKNQKLQVLKQNETLDIKIPEKCHPGESIYLGENRLLLIEVGNAKSKA